MMWAPTRTESRVSSMLGTPNRIDSTPISLPATAAAGQHYIKRSTLLSLPELRPPKHQPSSAYRLKAESISAGSTNSHITNVSIDSRPSSPQSSDSSHPNHFSSLDHAAYRAHRTTQLAMINMPPPIASPKTGPKLPSQDIVNKTPRQQIPTPAAHPTFNIPLPQIHLEQAMQAEVVDGFGKAVKFEDLIDPDFKTLVIFIRHFRSGYSQRYIKRLSKIANGEKQLNKYDSHSLRGTASTVSMRSGSQSTKSGEEHSEGNWIRANGVKVVVIGNGNYELIESYRAILNCPFPIYTDLSKEQKVYKLLGMKKIKEINLRQPAEKYYLDHQQQLLVNSCVQSFGQNNNGLTGIYPSGNKNRSEPLVDSQESKLAFLSKVLYNAWRMPWKWSGDPQQLGGELVFEPIRDEKRIKRKPIKYTLATAHPEKSISTRSTSSSSSNSAFSHFDQGSTASQIASQPIRRPSCSIKNNRSGILSRSKSSRSVQQTLKEVQIQCKFIHRMTNYQDHCSIDELMMMSGIRLTSLIQRF